MPLLAVALLGIALVQDPLAQLNIRDLTTPYPPSLLSDPYRGIPQAVLERIVFLSHGRQVDVVDRENTVDGPVVFVVRVKDEIQEIRARIAEDGRVLWQSG